MRPSRVAIVGIGETPTARHLDDDLTSLTAQAIELAAADAGIAVGDIDGVVTEYFCSTEQIYDLVTSFGWPEDLFQANIGLTGAGTVAAPTIARLAIEAGLATTVVCYFGVKWGSEAGAFSDYHSHDMFKASFEMPYGFFPQAAYMASMANRYLHEHGYTADDLGHVPINQRQWAALHPQATKRTPLDLASYHESPLVAEPLRNADCSLLSDGCAAFIMTTEARAKDLRQPPVYVSGCARAIEAVSEHSYLSVRDDLLSLPARFSGPRALKEAGLTADDVDLVELYDCFSIIPVLQLEDMGFCERGKALELYTSGATAPGGSLPVNTHGGLLAHSYLLGISHLCEAVTQLRGQAGERQVPEAQSALVTGWSSMEHSTAVLTTS